MTADPTEWTTVCRLDQIEVEGGVAALVGGAAVAVFRTHDDEVHALSNYDPVGRASVLARGIVGTRGGVPFVASPLHKQAYDLRTGRCLDGLEGPDGQPLQVPTYDVMLTAGPEPMVLVGAVREGP